MCVRGPLEGPILVTEKEERNSRYATEVGDRHSTGAMLEIIASLHASTYPHTLYDKSY